MDEREALLAIVRRLAAVQECDEDREACDWDSGPLCRKHGDLFRLRGLIADARALVTAADAGH